MSGRDEGTEGPHDCAAGAATFSCPTNECRSRCAGRPSRLAIGRAAREIRARTGSLSRFRGRGPRHDGVRSGPTVPVLDAGVSARRRNGPENWFSEPLQFPTRPSPRARAARAAARAVAIRGGLGERKPDVARRRAHVRPRARGSRGAVGTEASGIAGPLSGNQSTTGFSFSQDLVSEFPIRRTPWSTPGRRPPSVLRRPRRSKRRTSAADTLASPWRASLGRLPCPP